MSDHKEHASTADSAPQPNAYGTAFPPYGAPPGSFGAWAGPPPWAGAWPHPQQPGGWHGYPYPGYGIPPWPYALAPVGATPPDPTVGPATSPHHAGHHDLIAGVVVGAAAAYLLSNEAVQRTLIRGVVSIWSTIQGGIEEVKERFRDAEAELEQAAGSRSGDVTGDKAA